MAEKPKILLVEDEMPVAKAMMLLLARAGCDTQVATNGAEAIHMAQQDNFSLITLDWDLPDVNGPDLCRRLKEIPSLSGTPVVFVTAREEIQNGLKAGAVDFITKPFEACDFLSRISSLVTKNAIA
jgi:DNA-binding response OmpR family regulator